MSVFSDKRGESNNELLFPILIFLVLNLIFFVSMGLFVYRASSSALIFEQAYSKQVGLLIDGIKPGMEININFSNGFLVSDKNNFPRSKTLFINDNKREIVVRFSDGQGYSYNYYSGFPLTYSLNGDIWTIKSGGLNE